MAKLGAYYGLCPLIDHRSFLGVTKDNEDGIVIVTLGKNIAMKYRLSDQKALHSWRTKERFTSPIIYDQTQSQYLAVFNQTYIRMWSEDEEQLDKLKKYKFSNQIYTIFSCKNSIFIVFVNGTVCLLTEALSDHKNFTAQEIIKTDTEIIIEVLNVSVDNDIYVGLLVTGNNSSKILYWTKFNLDEQNSTNQKFYKIGLERENCQLTGYVFQVENKSVSFLSLWSDDRFYSCLLEPSDIELKTVGELFSIIESISCKEYVSMCSLDSNYIAMYGANCNEEGALAIIYNTQFKVTQSKQSFKMFTKGAQLSCIEQNLFLAIGQHLAVLPFHLDTEQLAALVGSHKETELDSDVHIVYKMSIANWNEGKKKIDKTEKNKTSKELKSKIKDYLEQGCTETVIIDKIFPDILETKNLNLISESIKYFTEIPEEYLVKLLKLFLSLDFDSSIDQATHPSLRIPMELQPNQRLVLINSVLAKSFNPELILPYIKSQFDVDEVLLLLKYICFLMSEEEFVLSESVTNYIEAEEKLIEWSSIIIDGSYQKILLTRDDRIINILSTLSDFVDDELVCLNDLNQSYSLLDSSIKGKGYKLEQNASNYSVERFELPI